MSEARGTTEPMPEELEGSNVRPDPLDDAPIDELEPQNEDAGEETRAAPPHLSQRGADFVARFEGCILRLYNDPTNNATIGVGHLVHMGPINGTEPREFRSGITREQALELLGQDARAAADAVRRLIKVPLEQHQVDALISFTFNCGEGSLQVSTLRKRLNAGEYSAVPHELGRWVFSQGKKLPGLVRRRQAEGMLFSEGRYQ
jgi:lysozyme